MTTAPGPALQPSPWLSVWLSPRDTIERILATNPRHHVLLLAGLGAASQIISELIDAGWTTGLLDWRVIGGVALVGATIGVAALYISALFFRWSGKILGGRASPIKMRAVLAWGIAPNVISLAICLIALIALRLFGGADAPEPASRGLTIALQAIIVVLALWSLTATMLMLGRVQGFGFWRTIVNFILGLLASTLLAVAFALLVRTFVFEPFNMPGVSMKPTFLVGDYLFVSKFSYGYSRFSFSLAPPPFSGRIFFSPPQRGDVVVFKLPTDNSTDYIKRVIGLPGDRVRIVNGVVNINDVPVERVRIENYVDRESGRPEPREQYKETLPDDHGAFDTGRTHSILILNPTGPVENTGVFVVPPRHYFMMGDNRDNSSDSRVDGSGVGMVPEENLVGRAEIIYFSIERDSHSGQPAVRFERLGMAVK